jgi:CRP-like cAMP-binding protein
VEALKLNSEDLVLLLEKFPILRFYIESQKRWRNENWQKMLSDVEKGVSEPQILPMLGEGVEEDSGKSFEEYQRVLNGKADSREYRAGEYVFKRGERSGELFIIESGRCDVEIRNEQGQVMTITQLGPGDHIGEQALLDGRPQFAFTVRCVTPVVLKAISEKQFFHLLGDRGHSNFARVVRVAMRQRRHLWVAKLLNLAHEDDVQTQLIALNPDETLFKVGEPIDQLYFVHRGSFVVTRPDGTVVRTMAAGETIGWEVFKEGGATSSATATCLSKAVVEALPKAALDGLIAKHRYASKDLEHAASTIVPEFSGTNLVRRRSVHQLRYNSRSRGDTSSSSPSAGTSTS